MMTLDDKQNDYHGKSSLDLFILLQKKHTFDSSSFPYYRGPGSVTLIHVLHVTTVDLETLEPHIIANFSIN